MRHCEFCCTRLEHVTVKSHHTTILDDVNMHIHCEKITAIIGPNGAGKTTLFKAILGEIPYEGKVNYVTHEEADKKFQPIIGYVPQHLNFDRTTPISVLDLFASCIQRVPVWLKIGKKFREQVIEALEEVQLEYAIDRKIGELSGGELQRVLLALALRPMPDILLLDEPISGVDINGKKMFYEIVDALRKKHHMAIVVITHDIPLLPNICDTAILLNKTVRCMGTPEEVLDHQETQEIFYLKD
ncbi:MAG: metal ABC transporter ATP-binding protein [Cellulosilyticaceae bacterium]